METIVVEKTVQEIVGYEAIDGTRFPSEEECLKYERSAKMAAYSGFKSYAGPNYNGTNFHDMFCIGFEDALHVIDIKDVNILQLVNTYLKTRSTYCDAIPAEYIGKKCLISLWEDDGCAVIGNREEMEATFNSWLDDMFGKKEVQEEAEAAPADDQQEDWFGIVRWCDGDIANALKGDGHEANDENIAKVRKELNSHWFTGGMIEAGWNYIHDVIWKVIEDEEDA